MQKAEDYTVFIKNSMAFPYFGEEYARNNLIGNNQRPCMFKVRRYFLLIYKFGCLYYLQYPFLSRHNVIMNSEPAILYFLGQCR